VAFIGEDPGVRVEGSRGIAALRSFARAQRSESVAIAGYFPAATCFSSS
jgi:hypothetical protein